MAQQTLGIGVIGCGGIASGAHLPNYVRMSRVRIVAVADIDLERARTTAARWGAEAYYQDYHDLLARPDVHAVSITTPVFQHAEPALAAMRAGKHVLCEKPIARTLEEADAMVAEAERSGVIFTMGYQPRFSRLWQETKSLLTGGLIGELRAVNLVSCGKAGLPAPWFLDRALSGGGVFIDWGIYTAFMLNWLAGPVSAVYAVTKAFKDEYPVRGVPTKTKDVEDTGVVVLEFQNGAVGTWYLTWAAPTSHGYTSFDGTEGSLLMRPGLEGSPLLFTTHSAEPPELQGWRIRPVPEIPVPEQHYRKIEHFVNAILDGTPLVMTGKDGRDALEVIMAIYRSAETHKRIPLPLPR